MAINYLPAGVAGGARLMPGAATGAAGLAGTAAFAAGFALIARGIKS